MNKQEKCEKITTYFIALVLMISLALIFLNSFYWPVEGMNKRKIVVGMIVIFGVVVVPVLLTKVNFFYHIFRDIIERIKTTVSTAFKNRKKIFVMSFFILLGIVVCYGLTSIVCKNIIHTPFHIKGFYALVALFFLCFGGTLIWKNAAKRVEAAFVLVAIIMGLFCIGVSPNRVGVSWDDEIHYERTLGIANALNGIMYEADVKNIREYASNIYARSGYDRISYLQYNQTLNDIYEAKTWQPYWGITYAASTVSYIPGAVGVIMARGLGLSYVNVFNAGRIVNLLCYVCLIYFAIKRIRHGKLLVALVGLIPTSVFMAANYSYDWWVNAFTILGFAYFFAELQDDAKLNNKNIIIMMSSIAIGCLPKASYFPLLFPLLFMPKKKFKSAKQRVGYYLFLFCMGIMLVAAIILPMFARGGVGTGDIRGGELVNSTEQVKYILNNPVAFGRTLIEFLENYISLGNAGPMLQRLAYIGEGRLYSVTCFILIAVSYLDRSDNYNRNTFVRIMGLIGCTIALVFSTIALYISFTAVGANTVAGMQGRYMIPLILPGLYFIGVGGIRHKINKNALVCISMGLFALTYFANMILHCVVYY